MTVGWPVRLVLMAACLAGCTAPPTGSDTIELRGRVTAGPTCPVERDPPDPTCEDRPVSGAEMVVLDVDGREVTRARSGEDGGFRVDLPPGEYQLVPQPVDGLMGTAPPLEVLLETGIDTPPVEIGYDTGIR